MYIKSGEAEVIRIRRELDDAAQRRIAALNNLGVAVFQARSEACQQGVVVGTEVAEGRHRLEAIADGQGAAGAKPSRRPLPRRHESDSCVKVQRT